MADLLVKKASNLGHKPFFKIPHTDLYMEIKESLSKQFIAYLEESARTTGSLHFSIRTRILLVSGFLINLLTGKKLYLLIEFIAITITLTICPEKIF